MLLRRPQLALLILVLAGVIRIASTYPTFCQTTDEPVHIAAGLQFAKQGRYLLDLEHPPLSRLLIGLPLRLARLEMPPVDLSVGVGSAEAFRQNVRLGNTILLEGGRYSRNLSLGRAGIVPFYVAATVVLFWFVLRMDGPA